MGVQIATYVRDNPVTFDMYFASIVSFQFHPANPAATRLTLDDCATIAIQMMQVRAGVMSPFDSVSAPPLGAHDLEGL